MPIGQIARGTDLKSAQHTNVQVAAAHHGKAVGVMEKSTTRQKRHGLFARIDTERGLLLVRGAVPGHDEGHVVITAAVKAPAKA